MHKKKYWYLFVNLIFPNAIAVGITVFLAKITTLSNIKIWFGEIGLDKIGFIDSFTLLSIIFYFILMVLYIKYIQNDKKELIPCTTYGDLPYFVYVFASVIMRIRHINLKSKPISLQFKILANQHLFTITKLDEIQDKKIDYVVNDDKKSSKVINLVIADTYPFNNNKLPDIVKNNRTIIIERKDKNTTRQRYNSKNLIQLVNKIVEKEKNLHCEYNLFLFTNPETNQSLYKEVFNTCVDGFVLNLYNYDRKNNIFSSKPKYTIK